MFNKTILVGNLCADPELKYSAQGNPICNFRLAVNTKSKQQGEQKDEVLFMRVVVFGKQAEPCSQYLAKGRPVLVEGRLKENHWEKDGVQHSRIDLIAQSVRFLGGGNKSEGSASHASDTGSYAPAPDEAMDEPF